MRLLLAAAALFIATPAVAVEDGTITFEEVRERALVCLGLLSENQEVANELAERASVYYNLDTQRKIKDFYLQCHMFMLGYENGERNALNRRTT